MLHSKRFCLAYFLFWNGSNEFQGELTDPVKIKSCEAGAYSAPVSPP
jgi:hypothetical protein